METKNCTKCNITKELNEFSNSKNGKYGKESMCKKCKSLYLAEHRKLNIDKYNQNNKSWRLKNSEYNKEYNKINKDKIKKSHKKYYDNNVEYFKNYHKTNYDPIKHKEYRDYYLKNNSDKVKNSKKKWLDNNLGYYNNYKKSRILNDPLYKLKIDSRNLIANSIRRNGYKKNSKACEILGCSFEKFKQHLESLFEPWMNWENYGLYNGELNYGWDIDHIIPNSSALTEDEVIKLNHYTNLQPLCSKVNRHIKRDKLKNY